MSEICTREAIYDVAYPCIICLDVSIYNLETWFLDPFVSDLSVYHILSFFLSLSYPSALFLSLTYP